MQLPPRSPFSRLAQSPPNRAEAMTVKTPSGIQNALNENSLLQDVQVACRHVGAAGLMTAAGGGYAGARRHITAATAIMAAMGTVRTSAAIAAIGGN